MASSSAARQSAPPAFSPIPGSSRSSASVARLRFSTPVMAVCSTSSSASPAAPRRCPPNPASAARLVATQSTAASSPGSIARYASAAGGGSRFSTVSSPGLSQSLRGSRSRSSTRIWILPVSRQRVEEDVHRPVAVVERAPHPVPEPPPPLSTMLYAAHGRVFPFPPDCCWFSMSPPALRRRFRRREQAACQRGSLSGRGERSHESDAIPDGGEVRRSGPGASAASPASAGSAPRRRSSRTAPRISPRCSWSACRSRFMCFELLITCARAPPWAPAAGRR